MYNLVLIILVLLAFVLSIYILIFCCSNDKFGNTDMNKICCGESGFIYKNNNCYNGLTELKCPGTYLTIIDGKPYCYKGKLEKCYAMSESAKKTCNDQCK